jgi:hypothetical protein
VVLDLLLDLLDVLAVEQQVGVPCGRLGREGAGPGKEGDGQGRAACEL